MENTEHNHTSFDSLPLPELRVSRARAELCGASVLKGLHNRGSVIHLRLLSAKGTDRDDTYELVGTEAQMQKLSELLARTLPSTTLYGSSPHATVSETAKGDLLVCLKEAGRKLIEANPSVDVLVQERGTGREATLTHRRIHPSLIPPFVTCEGRMWYHKQSQRYGTQRFIQEILRDGWAKMTLYIPI